MELYSPLDFGLHPIWIQNYKQSYHKDIKPFFYLVGVLSDSGIYTYKLLPFCETTLSTRYFWEIIDKKYYFTYRKIKLIDGETGEVYNFVHWKCSTKDEQEKFITEYGIKRINGDE